MINLKLLGEIVIVVNSKVVTTELSKKSICLLVYMAIHPNKLFYREQLAFMFWTGYEKESALSNLRYALFQIRKLVKNSESEDIFENSGKHTIKINPNIISSDYMNFLKCIKSLNYSEAVEYYNGDFLEHFYVVDVPEFSDWVFNERAHVQNMYMDAQLSMAQFYANNDNLKSATNALHKLKEIDPLNEIVYFHLIHYHYLSGNKVAAINTYRNLKQLLRNELNISPCDDIQKLYEQIMSENTPIKQSHNSHTIRTPDTNNRAMEIYVSNTPEELNQYGRKLASYSNTSTQLVMNVCDTPGLRINYEGLFEILNDLNEFGKYNIKQWKLECEQIYCDIKSNSYEEEIFLFKKFKILLNSELSEKHVFNIWNFQFLDEKTIDFLSYLFRMKSDKQFLILGMYDDSLKNERFEDFLKAHENNNQIIVKY